MDIATRSMLTRLVLAVLVFAPVGSLVTQSQGSDDVIKMNVTEGHDVILPCALNPEGNIEGAVFDWKKDRLDVFLYSYGSYYGNGLAGQDEAFKGRVSHFAEELKHGNASILLKNSKISDSGTYTCYFPHLEPDKIFRRELVVGMAFKNRFGTIRGVAPPPSVMILKATADGILLQCSVRGASPEPQVQWQTSDGTIVPAEEPQVSQREGLYNVTVLATVKEMKTMFRCVVKQDGFKHVIDNELFVPDIRLEDKSSYCTIVITHLIITIIVLVIVIAVGALIIIRQRWKLTKKRTEAETRETKVLR